MGHSGAATTSIVMEGVLRGARGPSPEPIATMMVAILSPAKVPAVPAIALCLRPWPVLREDAFGLAVRQASDRGGDQTFDPSHAPALAGVVADGGAAARIALCGAVLARRFERAAEDFFGARPLWTSLWRAIHELVVRRVL